MLCCFTGNGIELLTYTPKVEQSIIILMTQNRRQRKKNVNSLQFKHMCDKFSPNGHFICESNNNHKIVDNRIS